MTQGEQQDEIAKVVTEYFDKYAQDYIPFNIATEEREHIIYIGSTILCTKWEIGYPGGDFAQAIVNNDLAGAFGRADHINVHCIRFYIMLMYNVGMPTSLIQ
jgi:hypothetical protein